MDRVVLNEANFGKAQQLKEGGAAIAVGEGAED
jgi:hypothetical protein